MPRITAILTALLLAMVTSCAAVGKTLGEWLAQAESIGAVRCVDQASDPRGYAKCMGEAGADAAVIVAAGRLRDAVRKALSAPLPGTGAEADDAEREAARAELEQAMIAWERAQRGRH